ncbi:hypothetical protein TYRP_016195 [Tyrophagus putrescentiae]|nr:hypothetical protein TYRP_016195 [Tyrophagus putrescentiae]
MQLLLHLVAVLLLCSAHLSSSSAFLSGGHQNITAVNGTSSTTTTTATTTDQHDDCDPGWLYIAQKKRCYPKAHLREHCQFDGQCHGTVAHSFCAYYIDLAQALCKCVDDFVATSAGNCVPLERCNQTRLQFNSLEPSQADCRSPNAFCQLGVCHCKPGFKLDQLGDCVPRCQKKKSPYRSNSEVFAELRARLHRVASFTTIVFCANLILIAGLALYCTLSRKRKRVQQQQQANFKHGHYYNSLLLANQKEIFSAKVC